jgi:hypothetical protein
MREWENWFDPRFLDLAFVFTNSNPRAEFSGTPAYNK